MARIAESELIINSDGSVFHLHIRPEELADTVMVVGDQGRVDMIGEYFESREMVRQSREFRSITGSYKGKRMTVLSTGIGTDNIDIVMTELDALANVDFATREVKKDKKKLTILRIGSSGAIQPDIPLGSFVFSHISIGFDALLNWYADRDAVVDKDMEKAFLDHMEWNPILPKPYFVKASDRLIEAFNASTVRGMTISSPGFYGPQCRVIRLPLAMPDMMERLEQFSYGDRRITNFEMESSALAGLARHLGHDAGTVCLIIANRYAGNSNPDYKSKMEDLVRLSLDNLLLIK